MLLRCESQPARSGEIERARVSRHFAHHRSDIAAAQPFLEREERVLRLLAGDMDQAMAKSLGQSGTVRSPAQSQRFAILYP